MAEILPNIIYVVPFLASLFISHDVDQSHQRLLFGRSSLYYTIALSALAYVAHTITGSSPAWFTTSVRFDDSSDMFKDIIVWIALHSKGRPYRKLKYPTNRQREPGSHELDDHGASDSTQPFHSKRHSARSPITFEPSYGTCVFFHKGRLFVFRRNQQKGYFESGDQETMSLETLHWTSKPLEDLILEIRLWALDYQAGFTNVWVPKHAKEHHFGQPWKRRQARRSRHMDSVILDSHKKARIIQDISNYLLPKTAQRYARLGIPYRRGYLLYGPPGTGKSSLSFALAGHFGVDIYVLSLSSTEITNSSLGDLFNSLPKHCIVLLEDIDASGFTKARTTKSDKSSDDNDSCDAIQKASLDGLLNVIDGVDSPHGRVLIMTTNHRDQLDSALIRPGRVDLQIEFTRATKEEMEELFTHVYPDNVELAPEFVKSVPENTFTLAEIQGFLLENCSEPLAVVHGISAWIEERLGGAIV
jgi:chaperone BCS1